MTSAVHSKFFFVHHYNMVGACNNEIIINNEKKIMSGCRDLSTRKSGSDECR